MHRAMESARLRFVEHSLGSRPCQSAWPGGPGVEVAPTPAPACGHSIPRPACRQMPLARDAMWTWGRVVCECVYTSLTVYKVLYRLLTL